MECVWNTLWKAWISPLYFEKMYDWKSLYICTMRAMDMLDILKNERSYDDVDIMKRSIDSVDSEPHLLMTSTDVAAKEPSIGMSWIAKLVSYTLQALCVVGEWKHLVLLGKRAHFLTGGEIGDCFLPWVVFAQTQRCELQDTVVENNKNELATYVKEYEESQLKKKKKKSRLVIHEVITEEERHYHEERSRMEVELNKMAEHQKVLKDHLSHLMSLMDHSMRAKSMCLQSLHRAQKSVAKSLTYQESSADILTHFKSCVSLCRQKRSTLLLVQTLQEMGDYYFAESDISAAKRTWNDGIDAVFGSLTAATNWRGLINDLVVDGDGTWCALMCYNMLGKLIWTSLHEDLNQRLENALLGSALLCKLFSGSLSHPNPEQQWSFAEYTIRTDIVSFSHRPLRYIHPANVMLASTAMIETLLSNGQYIHALPLTCCMDYFASSHFLDARGSIQAKRMKAEACIGIGRMDRVCTLLNEILNIELVLHQSKRIGDPENEALHKWLLEFSVSKTISEFKFGSRLACLLCLTILRWIFTLGCNENTSPQGIALKHIAAQAAIQLQAMVQQGNYSNIASEEYGGGNDKPTPRAPDTEKINAIPRKNHDQVQIQDKLKIECECDFILSALSLEDGLTDSAREALQSAMQKCKQTVKPKLQEVHFDNVSSELDVLFWLKCRIQLIKCELMQGHHEGALRLCNISLLEANKSNERTYSRKIDALRVQALLLSGKRFEAENEGSKWLENDDPNTLTSTRVEMLLLLSQMKKTNMSSSHHHLQCLNLSLTYVKQAMNTINSITQQNGWIGVHFSSHSHESLINVYYPNLALYITTVCHLVTNLLQLYDINGSVEPLEKTLVRIEDGLRVLIHVSNPPSWMKAQLQFLKGCIIRRCGSKTAESIPYFLESLQIWLKDGGHPRKLMHQACMELVQVYGATGQLNDQEKQAQIQAAFHYLQMACKLQEQLYLLWNSTQLHFVSATSLDKLSAFLQQEIISIARSMSNDSTLEHLGHLVLPHFISQLREEDIIFDQSLSCGIKRSVTSLHSFLAQNHSQYSKQCYTVLPPIPKGDPEILGGLICVQWVKTSLSEITMYFAFGAAVNETDSRINATPILSRREGLSLTGVQELRHDAARIRQLLQDKGDNPEQIRAELTQLLEAIQLFYQNIDSNVRAARVHTPIPCTILEVSLLERIFDIQYGIFAVHGELCCHLRNALAEHSPDPL
ncbi:hypothetical protein AC1031_006277 [Aphanomyces cochlioides]|nr:hypothetical protein AC1031_006277 [Aphanomyces cochlioides]